MSGKTQKRFPGKIGEIKSSNSGDYVEVNVNDAIFEIDKGALGEISSQGSEPIEKGSSLLKYGIPHHVIEYFMYFFP